MMDVKVARLSNGVRIATDRFHSVHSVNILVKVLCGTRDEPAGAGGLAHFLEHMAFKGTKKRTALQITQDIEDRGGDLNAYTAKEATGYTVKVLKEDVGIALDVLSDIILNSTLPADEFERERDVIIQEIGEVEDNAPDWLFDRFMETAFHGGIGQPGLGTVESVSALSLLHLVTFMNFSCRRGDRIMVCASGNLDHDQFVKMVEDRFGDMAIGESLPPRLSTSYIGGEHRFDRGIDQAHLLMGFPGTPLISPDIYAAALLATVFGGTPASRLFQSLRERNGLCYDVTASNACFSDAGMLYAGFACAPENLDQAVALMVDEFDHLLLGLSENEIRRGKKLISASVLMSMESSAARVSYLDHNLTNYGRAFSLDHELEAIGDIDNNAIRRVVETMASAPPTLVVVAPTGSFEGFSGARQAIKWAHR